METKSSKVNESVSILVVDIRQERLSFQLRAVVDIEEMLKELVKHIFCCYAYAIQEVIPTLAA